MASVANNFKVWAFITGQKFKESVVITEVIYAAVLLVGVLVYVTPKKLFAFKLISQVHRSSRSTLLRKLALPAIQNTLTIHSKPRDPGISVEEFKAHIGTRIICIKPRISDNEKGVLLIKYSESMPLLPFFCDMERLLTDYTLVYEPSWSGYCTSDLLHFTMYKHNIFILSKQRDDYAFLRQLNCNLKPLTMGPCDWVNPAIAEPFIKEERKFDLVLNSNWSVVKRHHVLFKAMSQITPKLKVALIGFNWGGRSKQDILELARYYGVEDQLKIFEKISFDDVMKVNCSSKIAVLLSLKEGSNRAIAESLFCDTPAIVLKNHVGGIVENITSQTGKLVSESKLASEITLMLKNLQVYTPRQWAIDNISCFESTRSLNQSLKEDSLAAKQEWTQNLTVRTNSPDLRYFDTTDSSGCVAENRKLFNYIKT